MRIAVMQPYFFPYVGYWQLLNLVDVFVIFDDVNYIKKGYIDRNTILVNGNLLPIKLELIGASQNKMINEIDVGFNRKKLLKTIEFAYVKSRFYSSVFPVVEKILSCTEDNLARYLELSIRELSSYLGIKTKILNSSGFQYSERGKDRIIPIVRGLGGNTYINMLGGRSLYDIEHFKKNNIKLVFIENHQTPYAQMSKTFIPNLSILDLLFNVSSDDVSTRLRLKDTDS
jgi:hypothetical protein